MQDKNISFIMLDAANHYAASGFSVIPVNQRKEPTINSWKPYQEKIPDPFQISEIFKKDTYGVAIICGKVSGYLEVLDEDLKYDLTGTMHDEFVAQLDKEAPGLY